MRLEYVQLWSESYDLSPQYIDCVTAVMLKILDGKCKMKAEEKQVMSLLYHCTKHKQGKLLGEDIHLIIRQAETGLDEAMTNRIYETRLLAETQISRPVMKAFKADIRQQGLFNASAH